MFNVTIFCHQSKLDLINVTLKIMRGEDVSADPNLIVFETDQVDVTNIGEEEIAFLAMARILCRDKHFPFVVIIGS